MTSHECSLVTNKRRQCDRIATHVIIAKLIVRNTGKLVVLHASKQTTRDWAVAPASTVCECEILVPEKNNRLPICFFFRTRITNISNASTVTVLNLEFLSMKSSLPIRLQYTHIFNQKSFVIMTNEPFSNAYIFGAAAARWS